MCRAGFGRVAKVNDTVTAEEAAEAARLYWIDELQNAERFIISRKRERIIKGGGLPQDQAAVSYMKGRPALEEVLNAVVDCEREICT